MGDMTMMKPDIGIGTVLSEGTVIQINHDHIVVETIDGGKVTLNLAEAQELVGEEE
jgi:hypothetical protein